MKRIKLFEEFLSEAKRALDAAYELIDSLPKGAQFEDAKKIDQIFSRSQQTWSECIETFEKNQHAARPTTVRIKEIKITQPNIQSNKVKAMLNNPTKLPQINAVQFPDGIAIYDGHHRLLTLWALGKTKIRVNLVKPTLFEKDTLIKGQTVWQHIKAITPEKENIPTGFKKDIIRRKFSNVALFNIESLLKTDPDFKDYYDSGEERYSPDDINPRDLELEIVVVDGILLDGYSRVAQLLRAGITQTWAFVAL